MPLTLLRYLVFQIVSKSQNNSQSVDMLLDDVYGRRDKLLQYIITKYVARITINQCRTSEGCSVVVDTSKGKGSSYHGVIFTQPEDFKQKTSVSSENTNCKTTYRLFGQKPLSSKSCHKRCTNT